MIKSINKLIIDIRDNPVGGEETKAKAMIEENLWLFCRKRVNIYSESVAEK